MTQEMEALAFEGDEGFDLTEEEAEESARLYDEAQVVLYSQKNRFNPSAHIALRCLRARRTNRQRVRGNGRRIDQSL